MSGRLHLSTTPGRIAETLGILTMSHELRSWTPRYNIVPGQSTIVVRTIDGVTAKPPMTSVTRGRPLGGSAVELATARWGLVPRWAGEPDIGVRTIYARGEEASERPGLAEPFERRRCIIPADGLYEWTSDRRPVWFGFEDPESKSPGVAWLAGVWDRWEVPDTPDDVPQQARTPLDSFTILTAPGIAPPGSSPIDGVPLDRMPVVLEPADLAAWLDPATPTARAHELATRSTRRKVVCYEVGPWVNSPRHDSPRCIEPITTLGEGLVTGLFGLG